jgi:uncharacterized caspase-like protein
VKPSPTIGRISPAIFRYSIGLLLLALLLHPAYPQVRQEKLPDGVEHFYRTDTPHNESYFTEEFKKIYGVLLPSTGNQPFGKSVAFLVGVSVYHHLTPSLPSVDNDLSAMRQFLLTKGGFDEAYVATGDLVNRDLIEKYMKGVFASKLHRNDRLLFYYSGHGGDNQGTTGYMLFSNAQKGQFWGPQVLAIDTLTDWSQELQVQHILFILDSCASGLGINPKSSFSDSDKQLIQTLSGGGSRTVLTAGTASEATYAIEGRQSKGNGVFTKALLDAFDSRSLEYEGAGFITITDLFADMEKEMAKFRVHYGKGTTPRMWTLQETQYRGTFVFLNPRSASLHLSGKQAKAVGVASLNAKQSEAAAGAAQPSGVDETQPTLNQASPNVGQQQGPQTQLQRLLETDKGLTAGDRDRLSNAIFEYSQFLEEGLSLGGELNVEFGKIAQDQKSGALATSFDSHIRTLKDISTSAWAYSKTFRQIRDKWKYYSEQTDYIFGDNPDNLGPNALINASEGFANYLGYWSKIANKEQPDVLTLVAIQQNVYQDNRYFYWIQGCQQRLNQVRQSIQPNGVVLPIQSVVPAPAVVMF